MATAGLAYPVMKELRPHLTGLADFLERIGWQSAEGYRLVGSFDGGGAVVAAAHRGYLSSGFIIAALHFSKITPGT